MTHDGARTKQKSRLHMSHAQNDARYVERGKMIYRERKVRDQNAEFFHNMTTL